MAMLGLHGIIDRDRKAAFPEPKDVTEFRRYYRGHQAGTHTAKQTPFMRGLLSHPFCDNVCAKIVNEIASRHTLTGFAVESEPVAVFLADLIVKNHIAALQQDAGIATLRDGNHALALRWAASDPARPSLGRVEIHREPWWDGETGMFVAYGTDGQPSYAVKDWKETNDEGVTLKRRVVWFADHFERYIEQGDGWKAYPLPTDPLGSNGIVPWVKRDGAPLGIPVIHFANGSDDDSPYGASELSGGVLGFQDHINDVHFDITVTARMTGFLMYWATGSETEKDEVGQPKPKTVGPGQFFESGSKDARFGAFPVGDIGPQLEALKEKKEAVMTMRSIPIHVITGQWPSGAALLRSEIPLVGRVVRLNNTQAPPWASVAHRSTEMANTFGEGDRLDESALITPEFAPPERLDDLTIAEIAKADADVQLVFDMLSKEGLVAMGLTPEDAAARIRTREQQAEAFDARLTGIGGVDDGEAA